MALNAGATYNDAVVVPIDRGRFVVYLILRLVSFYVRHKADIDPHLSQDIINALMVLVSAAAFIAQLNRFGPR